MVAEAYPDQQNFEDWEVYAWCLRDAMSKKSGIPTTEFVLSDKQQYETFMLGARETCRAGDKVYRFKNGKIIEDNAGFSVPKAEDIRTPLLA